jgi:HAD superfamily hydrolase (TIGR01662 family)
VVEAVVFDVGETLVDETREYGTWADWLGIPRMTFGAVFGAVIASGGDYRDTFQVFRPGFDLDVEREKRSAAGKPESYGEDDLYPDVRPALKALRAKGFWIGIVGNQTARSGEILRTLALPADFIATSDDWGVQKPDPEFFANVVDAAPCAAERIVYVGDRLDNDLVPAKTARMRTAFVRRGAWGWINRNHSDLARLADWQLTDLRELAELLPC